MKSGNAKVVRLRIRNTGNVPARLRAFGKRANKKFVLTYTQGGTRITGRMSGAGWRTPRLAPGQQVTVRVKIRARPKAKRGATSFFAIRAVPVTPGHRADRVRIRAVIKR